MKAHGTTTLAVVAMAIVAFLFIGLGAAHVHRRHQVIRLGYELTQATDTARELREENRRLRLELSTLEHPERIERLAGKLGMRRAAPEQIRVVHERRTGCPWSSGRGSASHGGVAPRLRVPYPRPRRALPCSQLHALTRSGNPSGARAEVAAR